MIFGSKIRAAAEHLGITVSFARNAQVLIRLAEELHPNLIIINLQAQSFDPMEVGRVLCGNEGTRSTNLLGFFSHVNTGVQQQAREAGFTHIMPRSVFAARLGDILTGAL